MVTPLSKLPHFDPQRVPAVGTGAALPRVPEARLTPVGLRERFAQTGLAWEPEIAREFRFTDRQPAAAAVLIPLVERPEGLQVLLTERTAHLSTHSGQIAFPGGKSDPEDADAAADIETHPFFNTNNLWLDLRALAAELERSGGVLDLPLIRNDKTVDPTDPTSTPVVQIESAMGAAIEVFDGAVVLEVDRSRFLPVKTTNDLLVLRSDVYRLTDDQRLVATVDAPYVDLDPAHFRTIGAFDQRLPTAPSLAGATSLRVRGDWTFGRDVAIVGDAVLTDGGAPSTVPDGAWVGPTGIA